MRDGWANQPLELITDVPKKASTVSSKVRELTAGIASTTTTTTATTFTFAVTTKCGGGIMQQHDPQLYDSHSITRITNTNHPYYHSHHHNHYYYFFFYQVFKIGNDPRGRGGNPYKTIRFVNIKDGSSDMPLNGEFR